MELNDIDKVKKSNSNNIELNKENTHYVLNGQAVYRGLNAIIGEGVASMFVGMQNVT